MTDQEMLNEKSSDSYSDLELHSDSSDDGLFNPFDDDFDLSHQDTYLIDFLSQDAASLMDLSKDLRQKWKLLKSKTEMWRTTFKEKRQSFINEKRKNLKRKLNQQQTVLLRDKFTFVLGVSYIWLTTLMLSRYPDWFPLYYLVTILPLTTVRWFYYRALKWHFFLADLCYIVNGLLIVFLFYMPDSKPLFFALFGLANGPVGWAIYMWRNAMVFHSLDKITSIAIHITPAITMYTVRWMALSRPETNTSSFQYPRFSYNASAISDETISCGFLEGLFYTFSLYVLWQIVYYYWILVRNARKVFYENYLTSYTWLFADIIEKKKNKHLVKLFDSFHSKYHPMLFIILNFLFAVITVLPTFIFYNYFWVHTLFIFFLVTMSITNGADYYIEVFSKRYVHELQKLDQVRKLEMEKEKLSSHVQNGDEVPLDSKLNECESKKQV